MEPFANRSCSWSMHRKDMGIPDLRSDEPDIKRAAIAMNLIDPNKGLDQPLDAGSASVAAHVSRMDLIHGVFKNPPMNLLHRLNEDYDLQPFTFGEKVSDFGKLDLGPQSQNANWFDTITAKEPLTKLGDAVSDLLGRTRGQPVAGIVLVTDGQSNSGRSIVSASEQAKLEGVPLYIYGVGISNPKDIIVSNLFTRDVAFVNDELPVTVRVRNQGLGGEPAHIVLTLNGTQVDAQDITLDESGDQVVPMKFTPTTKGEYNLKARIEPRADEASKDNNEVTEPLKVVDDKIKVLYVEKSPRWEFKYLSAMLSRDRRVDFKCFLVDGDPALADGENSPFIKQFPATAEELTKFDLLILGDVDPKIFTDQQVEDISRWVQAGGGGDALPCRPSVQSQRLRRQQAGRSAPGRGQPKP